MKMNIVGWMAVWVGWCGTVVAAETGLEGLIFAGYQGYVSEYKSDGTGANSFNAFMVQRIYLTGSAKFSDQMNGKVVLEGNSLSAGNAVFLKAAFIEWKEVAERLAIHAGMPLAPWRGFEEGMWKYRFVEKIQEDLEGLLKPADNGVKAVYGLPGGHGTIEAMVANGEGFSSVEVSKDKDVQARLTVVPAPAQMKEFSVSLYGLYGKANADRRRERVMALMAYDGPQGTIAGSTIAAWDQAVANGGVQTQWGFSVYGSAVVHGTWSVLARWDSFDPDVDVSGNRRTRVIGGVSHDFGNGVKVAFSDHWLMQETETVTQKHQHQVQANLSAKF